MGIAKSRTGIQGGVEVIIADNKGLLQLRHRGNVLNARFASRIPEQIKVGHELHLRVQTVVEGQVHPEVIDVLGSVLLVEADDVLEIKTGSRFQFGITRSLSDKLPLPVLGREGVNALLDAWRRALLPSRLANQVQSKQALPSTTNLSPRSAQRGPPPLPGQQKRARTFTGRSSISQMNKTQRMAVLKNKVAKKLSLDDYTEDQALPFASFFADQTATRSLPNPDIDVSAFADLPVPPTAHVAKNMNSNNTYHA